MFEKDDLQKEGVFCQTVEDKFVSKLHPIFDKFVNLEPFMSEQINLDPPNYHTLHPYLYSALE